MNKNRWAFLGILILAVLVAFAPCVSAQESAAKGSLNGTVVDSTGGSIVGANVTLTGPFGNQNQTTNGQGIFIFQDLIPGTYKVRIEMKGFRAAEVPDVTINVGRVSAIRVQLEPGSITSTVEVVASAVTVDTTSTAVATNLNDDFYNKLPVQRGVAGLFYLAPGVVSGGGTGAANPSIGGATGLENLYIADGVSITDTAFGGLGLYSRVYGSVGTGINLSFIKEVQVKTGSIQSQYGGATGGVVQIVTKSGGNQYHGALAGYAQPYAFEATRTNVDQFNLANPFGDVTGKAGFDASGEVGGPIPVLGKDKLFFFGSFDPSWVQTKGNSPPLEGNAALGTVQLRELSYNYAAKLTFKLNDKNTLEGSVFGDPTYSNFAPWSRATEGVSGIPNTSNFSKLQFANRDVVARYNGTLSPTWILNIDATWQHNKFTESGYDNVDSRIIDQTQSCSGPPGGGSLCSTLGSTTTPGPGIQQGQFTPVGQGFVENTEDEAYGAHVNTSKIVNFWGQHSIDIGYGYNRPFYKGIRANSGPAIAVPDLNQDGNLNSPQCTGVAIQGQGGCPWDGTFSNYEWTLNAVPGCPVGGVTPVCTLLNVPGLTGLGPAGPDANLTPVALELFRGEFNVASDGFKHFSTTGRNHSAYVNDSWTINKYVTLNAGIRWQQERLIGENTQYTFTDNWSPTFGVIVDPWGDRKNKISFSFGRYNYNLPLDLAERSLTNETDLFLLALAPAFTVDASGNRVATINQFGTVTPIVDGAHTLNQAAGSPFPLVFGSLESLESIHTGTKLTYEDEYVMGYEHEFSHGIILSARYMHRSLRRIVEDTGGIAPEAANAGIPQQFSITNPHKSTDIFTNPVENDFTSAGGAGVVSSTGDFPAGTVIPGSCFSPKVTPPAPGSPIPVGDIPFFNFPTNSFGNPVTDSQGNNAACFNAGLDVPTQSVVPAGINGCPTTDISCTPAGSVVPDGIPDGFADPIHKYWAVVIEVNKSFSHNWQLRANYTVSRVFGNFEGAFRNDNGQSDPGISSLFDFTTGNFNQLGGQFTPGLLNQDREQVANGYFSYVFDHGMLKNLTLGSGLNIATGTPITELGSHPVYLNSGEIPIGGRGALGRTPTTGTVNFHADYLWSMTERFHLRFGADLFNIADTKRVEYINETDSLKFGVANADFLKPNNILGTNWYQATGIQAPFNARLFARLEF
ncbi:MAG: carboxypeptidase regulatory-like domain-containing protein [Candidatus Acidiferrales bacterium]